jgi:arylsulfatase A-like enzyme
VVATFAFVGSAHDAESATGDNVIFILTDDESAEELAAMPYVQSLIAAQGVTFERAYAQYPLCCPSRAGMLSGQYMHNHGVRGNVAPTGGWESFIARQNSTLPVWTDVAGYHNVHIGKYMNGYVGNGTTPNIPPGWDEWYGKVSEPNLYFNYTMVEKPGVGDPAELVFYGDQDREYQTDVLRDKAREFIVSAGPAETPFMMNLWFNAPHSPFDPAPRHRFILSDIGLPRLAGFNEKDISDKPKWLRKQAKRPLKKGFRQTIAAERRRRLEQLLSVDEAVAAIVADLSREGLLEDTYIVVTSDHGFFRGEHRIAGGKFLPHEPSSRVPIMIRGPGIPRGVVSEELVANTDITQTILEIATGSPNPGLDGRSLLPYATNPALRSTRPILIEADTGGRGGGVDTEGVGLATPAVAKAHLAGRRGVGDLDQEPMANKSAANGTSAPAYRAVRTDRYLYVLYANGQKELYDMRRDPKQLRSVHRDKRYRRVRKQLSRHLFALSGCAGPSCRFEVGPDPKPEKGKPEREKDEGKRGKSEPDKP